MYLGAALVSFIVTFPLLSPKSSDFQILLIVFLVNKKKVKERRFKGPISEAYQVRENIRTSRLLLQIFIIFSFFVGFSTYFLLRFSASLTDPSQKWVTIKNGFIYDMLISIGTTITTLVFLQFLIPDEKLKKWLHILRLPCQHQNVTPASKRIRFRSIHGGEVEVGNGTAEEEARVYFTQLSAAWKL
uniref:Serpentine receptor class gamma n=1 Tax=Caenorhabditis tropicalis TaxID=1561998 RepID=A0A1I7T5E1_9PELO